jgi:hypothetical protein
VKIPFKNEGKIKKFSEKRENLPFVEMLLLTQEGV